MQSEAERIAKGEEWTPYQLRIIRRNALNDIRRRILAFLAFISFPVWYFPFCLAVGMMECGSLPSMFREGVEAMRRQHKISMLKLALHPERLQRFPATESRGTPEV